MEVYSIDFGLTDYNCIWQIQREINSYKQKNKCSDLLIFTEHKNVYTLGRAGDKNHLLLNKNELQENKIDYFEIDRGGDLTYHGPGQLVCYPIFDLNNYYLDSHRYLRDLEEVIMMTLKDFGIESSRDEQYTGVWIKDEKICSIGIKISRWITMHGLALNVNNDLSYFDKIIPCGIFHKGVTSISKVKEKVIDMNGVMNFMSKNFQNVFSINIEGIKSEELFDYYRIGSEVKE